MADQPINQLEDMRFDAGLLVRWYWRTYVRAAIPTLILVGLFMVMEGVSLGLFSRMVQPMFDDVFIAGDKAKVFGVGFIIFAIFIGRAIAGFLQRLFMASVARRLSARIQKDLLSHVIKLDDAFFHEHGPGTLMERVRGDGGAAVGIISTTLSAIGRDVVALIALLYVAISVDWIWTAIALLGAPFLSFPVVILQRFLRNSARIVRQVAGRVTRRLDEIFHGIRLVKLQNIEDRQSRKFEDEVDELVRHELRNTAASAGIPALMDIVAGIGFLGVVTYGGFQIIDGEKTVGEFMSFFTAIALMFEPIRRLAAVSGAWQGALVSLERIYALFQQRAEITSPANPDPMPADPRQADLGFETVSFQYGDQTVLSDISFVAEAGKTTAFVGPSGAGKSTLFNLITRLIDSDTGQITLGGTDIRNLDLNSLRDTITVVAQETHLFDESLRDNIVLDASPDEKALQSALDQAHVSEFLKEKPGGLESRAGPRGSNLSGGQRQRVAIARALLRNTPILLLDEATSALDTESERLVQDALNNLSQQRTTLVIAHRLSTIRNADKIVVMEKGKVVETGKHDELIEKDGLYANLCRLQFQETDS